MTARCFERANVAKRQESFGAAEMPRLRVHRNRHSAMRPCCGMRIMIVTDAWFPQTNGVVRTLAQTAAWLGRFGHEVRMLTPRDFRSVACPTYPEIRLSLLPRKAVRQRHRRLRPAGAAHRDRGSARTGGPALLPAAAAWRFTTSYHTQFPQYVRARFPIPLCVSYWALRRFHGAAVRCMVSTGIRARGLAGPRFQEPGRLAPRRRHGAVQAAPKDFLQLPRPIAAYVGRVAVEKNIDAFLRMPWSGSKIVIGDGPERARLEAQHPDVVFTGFRFARGSRASSRRGGCHGVPQPHRHLRSGQSGGDGLRRAGRRVSGLPVRSTSSRMA